MKQFANLSAAKLADMIGIQLVGRNASIIKSDSRTHHFLTAQIHLYIALHFYANSNDGSTDLIEIQELADLIGRNIKTVKRSMKLLEACGLLTVSYDSSFEYAHITLLNLSEMYLRRGEGGKGYITCNQDMLYKLLAAKKINSLRTVIITLLVSHSYELSGATRRNIQIRLLIKDLKAGFPRSIRPRDIWTAASPAGIFGTIFDRIIPDTKKAIVIHLKDELNGKHIKSSIQLEAKAQIQEEISFINTQIGEANISIEDRGYMPVSVTSKLLDHEIDLFSYMDVNNIEAGYRLPILELNSKVRHDCAIIAQDYGIDTVIRAIRIYYSDYLLSSTFKPEKGKSLGGLIRAIVADLFKTNNFAPSLAF